MGWSAIETHTAQYVTPGAGPPLHNSILSPSTLLCAQCKTSVCVTADWKSGRLSDLHGDTTLKNDVCNRVGWWTQWLHLLPTVWSIGNGQKIRSTRLMWGRFSSSQTHTHSSTTPLYRLFLSHEYTHTLAGWLGSHTTHTLHTSRANTHGSSNAQTILSNLSPSHLPSFLPMRARHQFPSGGGKRVFGWGPRWLSRPPLDVTTRQRLCRANNKTTAETLRVEFSVQRI
jgi:hypothetical protein